MAMGGIGGGNIDTLITIYSIQNNYTEEADHIAGSTLRMIPAFYAARMAIGFVERAIETAANALIKFTRDSIQEAAKIERVTYTFGALAGSMGVAAEKMDYLRKFALQSVLQFDDLAQAGTVLEAAGLRMEKFLPSLSNVVAAFGGGKDQIMEFAEALARIPSGMFGESERIFRRFGITASDFMAQGLAVNHGRIEASAEQVLQAILNIAQQKFGSIGTMLQQTISVRFSNLQDAWNQLMASFGIAFGPLVAKITDILNPFIQFLTQSGMINRVGAAFANLFNQAIGDGTTFIRILAYMAVFFETLPARIVKTKDAIGDWLKGFGSGMAVLDTFLNNMQARFNNAGKAIHRFFVNIFASIIDAFGSVQDRLQTIGLDRFGGKNAHKEAAGLRAHLRDVVDEPITTTPNPFDWGKGTGSAKDAIRDFIFSPADQKRVNDLVAQFGAFRQNNNPNVPDASQFSMWNGLAAPMADTAKNTGVMAKTMLNWDAKRIALGGGELARMGVTPLEMFQGRRPAGAGGSINVTLRGESFDDLLKNALSDAIRAHRLGQEVSVR